MQSTRTYVAFICAFAIVGAVGVYAMQPMTYAHEVSAVIVLAALAAVAELLAFALPRSSHGSIAFIPYLAAVMIAPSWSTIVAAAAARCLTEVVKRRDNLKRAFNVAQITVTLSVAVAVYRLLGGVGMLSDGIAGLGETTVASGLPALAAFVVSFAVNQLLVHGVVSIADGVGIKKVWKENGVSGLALDVLASPIVFVFAWVFAEFGPMAAFAAWAPILGLRHLSTTTLELERTNQELLELMVKSIEARDSYTSGHSRRVRDYAERIARVSGLSDRDVTRVSKAALLHDVGKIHEKYAPILAKADKLSPDEWHLMQQHPQDGAELVGTMTRLRELIPAIRHHHEQWDGGGYPDGLAGDSIPVEARIIALADTIDAMTSERPYRPALTVDEVRRELQRCRGRQFDPRLVDTLLESGAWAKIFGPARGAPRYGSLSVVPPGTTVSAVARR